MTREFRTFLLWCFVVTTGLLGLVLFIPSLGWSAWLHRRIGEYVPWDDVPRRRRLRKGGD